VAVPTRAHLGLIQAVKEKSDRVLIVLGTSVAGTTIENPIDYDERSRMMQNYGMVVPLADCLSHVQWSANLDALIDAVLSPGDSATLYGGRDAFDQLYRGRFEYEEIEMNVPVSGTEERRTNGSLEYNNSCFRAGMIRASMNQFPKVHPTVDIAIWKSDKHKELLMARKPNATDWCFVGGFADPEGSYEQDARREVHEETGIEITDPVYVGSCIINDWRYSGRDKIKTILFECHYQSGSPMADDDIAEVQWMKVELAMAKVSATHSPLMNMLTKGQL